MGILTRGHLGFSGSLHPVGSRWCRHSIEPPDSGRSWTSALGRIPTVTERPEAAIRRQTTPHKLQGRGSVGKPFPGTVWWWQGNAKRRPRPASYAVVKPQSNDMVGRYSLLPCLWKERSHVLSRAQAEVPGNGKCPRYIALFRRVLDAPPLLTLTHAVERKRTGVDLR